LAEIEKLARLKKRKNFQKKIKKLVPLVQMVDKRDC
jgi:hypothetical protein